MTGKRAVLALLLLAACFLAYSNGANDNFKGVASLFGSRTCNYKITAMNAGQGFAANLSTDILVMGKKRKPTEICPRFRIRRGPDIAIGPGKAELLEHLQQTRSIARAAKSMKMSYMRAWTLIRTMERCFKQPLVRAARGGAKGGGAALTETGQKVLSLYQRLETESLQATQATWSELRTLLRD
jgi:molybdate transport system regulatory protein